MSQTFQVLRCSECSTFQVHQVKKSIKWSCKMCGGKQSTICNYGTGTGKECRLHVQKLNSMRGDLEQSIIQDPPNCEDILGSDTSSAIPSSTQIDSKWSKFVENISTDVNLEPQDPDSLHGVEATLEIPKEKKRKSSVLEPKPFSTKMVRDIPETRRKFGTPYKENKPNHHILDTSSCNLVDFENGCENLEPKIGVTTSVSRIHIKINTQIQDKHVLPVCSKDERVKVNKNSKWAQFVANENCDEEYLDPENITSQTQNLSQYIFSQCSDEDIDALLDI